MKKIILHTSLILLCFFFVCPQDADAQRRGEKETDEDEYFDESGGFKHRLWYGAGGTLGYSGSNGSSQFQIGLSPMVGYKITDNLSVGPRVFFTYSAIRESIGGQIFRTNPTSYGAGAFVRYKAFPMLFAHTEFGISRDPFYAIDQSGNIIIKNGNEIAIVHQSSSNFYLGAGYNSSGGNGTGFEVVLLYNFLEPADTLDLPFELRFGFTWNF